MNTIDAPNKKQLLQIAVEECSMCSGKVMLKRSLEEGNTLICSKCVNLIQNPKSPSEPWFPVSSRTTLPR